MNDMRVPFRLFFLPLALALCGLWGCESGLECRTVTVNSGCQARCARVIDKDGGQWMCTDQVMSTSSGENSILQRQTRKVTTKRLDKEVCCPVVDRTVADEAIRKQLGLKCQDR